MRQRPCNTLKEYGQYLGVSHVAVRSEPCRRLESVATAEDHAKKNNCSISTTACIPLTRRLRAARQSARMSTGGGSGARASSPRPETAALSARSPSKGIATARWQRLISRSCFCRRSREVASSCWTTRVFIATVGCVLMFFPAYSPDLNHIERIRATLKRMLRGGLQGADDKIAFIGNTCLSLCL